MPLATYNGFPGDFRERQARQITAAFRRGDRVRPTECHLCTNQAPAAVIHTHNEDYHFPLDYVPLCYSCHMALHRRYRDIATWDRWVALCAVGWKPPAAIRTYGPFMSIHAWVRRQPLACTADQWDPWALNLPRIEPDLYGNAPVAKVHPNVPQTLFDPIEGD